MFGEWNINVVVDAMPQKVATAIGELADQLIGAEYKPIAYLGSQVVNGTNHAVLAEQTILSGKDTKNLVVLIFNEKPNDSVATLVSIERVVEGGEPLGGTKVNVEFEIPVEAQEAFDDAFDDRLGAKWTPMALLATKVTKGTNYVYLVEETPVVSEPVKSAMLVTVNGMTHDVAFADLLASKHEMSLGYAFTWLKNPGFGTPLGEWP
jgi:hypothetical protein